MKTVGTRCVFLVALFVFVTNFAQAGSKDTQKAIRGLSELELVIDGLDSDAGKCGITGSLIRDAFMFPVSSSRLNIVQNAPAPAFSISVTTIPVRNGSQCITSLEVAVIHYQRVKLDYKDDEPSWVTLRLWDNGGAVFSSIPANHPRQIQQGVEDATKRFITIWNIANKDILTNSSGQH
jgi:hypothetical protein